MEDSSIADNQITASSIDGGSNANYARFNHNTGQSLCRFKALICPSTGPDKEKYWSYRNCRPFHQSLPILGLIKGLRVRFPI